MSYFRNINTRKFKIVAGIGSTAIFILHTLPHMIPAKIITSRLALPSQNPRKRYENLLEDVCEKMAVDPGKVGLFYNRKLSTVSGGCLYFPGKAVIGLPPNCYFSSKEDTKNLYISLMKSDVNWDLKIEMTLQDVLKITDDQVRFLIAHELVHIKNLHFVINALHAIGFFLFTYAGGLFLILLFQQYFYGSIIMQCVVWYFGFRVYNITHKRLSHWLEYTADEKAARLGTEYCNGGIEYMNNQLELNYILKKTCDPEKNKLFSEEGNNLQTISTHPKRTDRLNRLNELKRKRKF